MIFPFLLKCQYFQFLSVYNTSPRQVRFAKYSKLKTQEMRIGHKAQNSYLREYDGATLGLEQPLTFH